MLERIPKTNSILQHTIMRKIMQQKIYIFIKCFYYSERAVPWRSFHEICLFLTMHHFYKVTSLSAENFFCKKESSSEMQSSVFTGRLDICWFWIAVFFTYAYILLSLFFHDRKIHRDWIWVVFWEKRVKEMDQLQRKQKRRHHSGDIMKVFSVVQE